VPHELSRRINALAALFEIADREFLAIKNQISDFTDGTSSSIDQPPADGRRSTVLDFLPVLNKHFPRFRFHDQKLRGFVDELQLRAPPMAPADLDAALTSEKAALREYAKHQWFACRNSLNPVTLVRHALYLRDPGACGSILSDTQRARFDEWREDEARHRVNEGQMESGTVGDGRDPDWFPE